jgi:hypothetical protein
MLITLLTLFSMYADGFASTYFVSPTGNDSGSGTIGQPFLTIPKAYSVAVAGDTIYVRGGLYTVSATISLSKSGTSAKRYYLLAYPGERPILDCSTMAVNSSNRGIKLSGSYWTVKGFDVKGAGDNGMILSGSNNVVEFCAFYENSDTGLQLGSGASENRIINCDSYFNADPSQGNADGFAPKLDVGSGNYFYGCRAWQNSDDGWDGYLRPSDSVNTTIDSCWSFDNGYLKTGAPSTGNGNGFKMGGGDNGNADSLRHNMMLRNCLAFDNRVKGYDQNNNRGSMTLLNCTAYRNGSYNFSIPGIRRVTSTVTVVNCVSLASPGVTFLAPDEMLTDSWMSPFSISNADFASVDTTGIRGPRKPDGSLPDLQFMHLAAGSQLIDAGTNVGLPYVGLAPDLGAFEYGMTNSVYATTTPSLPASFRLLQNFPNPFNPSTVIMFQLHSSAYLGLKVYDVFGREIATVAEGIMQAGVHRLEFDGSRLSSGTYFATLRVGQSTSTIKLMLLK